VNASLSGADWLTMFVQFLLLSCLSVGGAITTAPEMHRILVDSHRWLTNEQFVTSIALAQAAPGPNILFVALLGWNVGLNAGGGLTNGFVGWTTAFAGALVTMTGMLIPSTTLTYVATRWGHRNRELRAVRAFKQGLAPIVVGLLVATGWVLVRGDADSAFDRELVAVAIVSMLVVWRTQVHILWLLGAGALLGAMGLV
jgi:chromate transporter